MCPEVQSGLGVPRVSISLRGGNGDDFWEGNAHIKNRDGLLLDDKIKKGSLLCYDQLKEENIDVFIFMEGSPSCGVYRTSLKGQRMGKPPGIFGSLLLKEQIFLIPAVDLQSPIKWWDWRRRMYAYVWLKYKNFSKINELYDAWHIVKFLCQEINFHIPSMIGGIIPEGPTMFRMIHLPIAIHFMNHLYHFSRRTGFLFRTTCTYCTSQKESRKKSYI